MKKIIYLIVFISINVCAQSKYLTKTGQVSFEASVPSVEEVKADNKSVTAILNIDNGEFAALVFVKGFRFKNALMEEHFNENYAESDTYPKAIFKGKILDLKYDDIETKATYKVQGELTFHGEVKELKDITFHILKDKDNIVISGEFEVSPSDFDIKIPKIVSNKIAETVKIKCHFILKN